MDSDGIILLLFLVLATLIVLPIVALVVSNTRTRQLRTEMDGLLDRLRYLERWAENLTQKQDAGAIRQSAGTQPGWTKPESAPGEITGVAPIAAPEADAGMPIVTPLSVAATVAPPQFASLEQARTGDSRSLESRIGSQWFNRIGILAVLIAVAWFLKLAFDNHWIGPLGRVLIGLVAGAALIGWSERFHRRGYPVFSYSLKAIGSGTLYLSLWAAFQLYALIPPGVAFAAMIAVTAFNGAMAWVQESELLALYAIAGGLSTPLLVSTGGNHEVSLFSYLLMLDLAVLALAALRPWSRLLFVSFAGTVVFVAAWWFSFYAQWQAVRTAFFLFCFFLLFSLAPRLIKLGREAEEAVQGWDALAGLVLPVAAAALGFIAFYSLLDTSTAEWSGPWLAVGFAAYYLVLVRLPKTGVLHGGVAALAHLHLTAAIVFLTIAIPLETHGRWMTIGWMAEGAALLWISLRVRSLLLRGFGLICTVLGLGALLTVNPPAATRLILNERFATYCAAIAACAFIAWLARRSQDEEPPSAVLHWPILAAAAMLAVNALVLIAFSLEIHSYCWFVRWRGNYDLFRDYSMYAQFSYSALFMVYGGVLLTIGFLRRSAFLRWQALALLAVTIAKVFLADVSELGHGLRILSFLGLGVLLLGVSFVYQRDLLNLRGRKDENR